MSIFYYFFKYQIFFRYYLILLFFFNLYICYNFIINQQIKLKKNNKNTICEQNTNYKFYMDKKYYQMLKKINKIINNPIIFEYQIIQSLKIDENTNKYIKYHEDLNIINKHNDQYIKSYKYLNKIYKSLSIKNKDNIGNIDILTKLLYINF
jgi:ADP-dependent phosphofructokinase/glucokinase